MPHLRIIEEELWKEVRARQGAKTSPSVLPIWEQRRPKFLLSGLTVCGCCGGGFSTIAKDRFGCSNSRNKGTSVCSNRTGISRPDLEGRILTALSDQLMDPDLVKAFAEQYIAERNRLAARHTDDRAVKEKELAKVIKDQDALVNALLSGLPPERIKAKMEQPELRRKQLERDVAAAPARAATVRIHPKMADTYHDRICGLIAGLTDPDRESEAREAIRGLIEKIVAMPVPTSEKRSRLELTLHGDLAGILALSLGVELMSGHQKTSCEQEFLKV
ncbi:zinc ribbon domain-containing protein [Falsirhodobacter algicola]|nr:zinc ribbon domain-containing protein [Falsirhodobacter algicola]